MFRFVHNGGDYTADLDKCGLILHGPHGDRLIPWETLAAVPVAWVVVADGELHRVCPTQRDARDRAADLASSGVAATVTAVPPGFAL